MRRNLEIVELVAGLFPEGDVFLMMCTREEDTIPVLTNASISEMEMFRDALDEAIDQERDFPAAMRN